MVTTEGRSALWMRSTRPPAQTGCSVGSRDTPPATSVSIRVGVRQAVISLRTAGVTIGKVLLGRVTVATGTRTTRFTPLVQTARYRSVLGGIRPCGFLTSGGVSTVHGETRRGRGTGVTRR